ncbi:MFS multidrug transporter [Dacryopinax primogenitus]|uniref:MFS multidrug transporter n=1 Tax=Dacryopinax primogenitus (strain DJM 731) TaxID=1858805 RepID=M5GDV4_DACPD|nr:MFS multidrug transporter [Dacryopinax primogenitus]EJU04867.1 MFS multidrug transporter [Dacryopinax primogenitus]
MPDETVTAAEPGVGTPNVERDIEDEEEKEAEQARDVEKGGVPVATGAEEVSGGKEERDPNMISWDGPDDPLNPQNWSFGQKWAAMGIVSVFTFMSPLSSSMVAPALPQISRDLGITGDPTLSSMTLSIFVLGFAVGPLVLGPLSEIYGRVRVLQLANLFFLIFNIAGGFAQSKGQMMAFRFLSGFGGGGPIALGGGVLGDMFLPEQRGLAQALYSLGPLSGPAIGPMISGFIVQSIDWRWIFWITSIVDGVIQVLGLILLRETYAPKLLGDKVRRLKRETGNDKLYSVYDKHDRSMRAILSRGMVRPFIFLGTEPLCQIIGTYMALMYGVLYLLLTTFAELWVTEYGESSGIAGLNYLAIGAGYTAGSQIGAWLIDATYRRMKVKNNDIGLPEFRIPIILVSAPISVLGLILYGWTAQYKVFWFVPDLGVFIYGMGTLSAWLAIQTYLVDTYTLYAASAIAATALYRSLLGFAFPLFANQMYAAMGQGWANTMLAFITLIIGVPAPLVFLKYGHKLRERSSMARKSRIIR